MAVIQQVGSVYQSVFNTLYTLFYSLLQKSMFIAYYCVHLNFIKLIFYTVEVHIQLKWTEFNLFIIVWDGTDRERETMLLTGVYVPKKPPEKCGQTAATIVSLVFTIQNFIKFIEIL